MSKPDAKDQNTTEQPFDRDNAEFARAVGAHSVFTQPEKKEEEKAKADAIAKVQNRQRQRWLPDRMRDKVAAREEELSQISNRESVKSALKDKKFFSSEQGSYPYNETTQEARTRWKTEYETNSTKQSEFEQDNKKAGEFKSALKKIPKNFEEELQNIQKQLADIDKKPEETKTSNSKSNTGSKWQKKTTDKTELEQKKKALSEKTIKLESAIVDAIYPEYTDAKGTLHNKPKNCKATLYLHHEEKNKDHKSLAKNVIIFDNTDEKIGIVYEADSKTSHHHYIYHEQAEVYDQENGVVITPKKITEQIISSSSNEKNSKVYYQETTAEGKPYLQRQSIFNPDEKEVAHDHSELNFVEFTPDEKDTPENQKAKLDAHINQCNLLSSAQHYKFVLITPDKYILIHNKKVKEIKKADVAGKNVTLSQDDEKRLTACLSAKNKNQLKKAGLMIDHRPDKTKLTQETKVVPQKPSNDTFKLLTQLENEKLLTPITQRQEADERYILEKTNSGEILLHQTKKMGDYDIESETRDFNMPISLDLQELRAKQLSEEQKKPYIENFGEHFDQPEIVDIESTDYFNILALEESLELKPESSDSKEYNKPHHLLNELLAPPESSDSKKYSKFNSLLELLAQEESPELKSESSSSKDSKPHPLDQLDVRPYNIGERKPKGALLYRKTHKEAPVFTKLKQESNNLLDNTNYDKKTNGNITTFILKNDKQEQVLTANKTNKKVTLTTYTETRVPADSKTESSNSIVLTRRYQGFDEAGKEVDFFEVNPVCEALIQQSKANHVRAAKTSETSINWKRTVPKPFGPTIQLTEFTEEKENQKIKKSTWKGIGSNNQSIGFFYEGNIAALLKDPRNEKERSPCYIISEISTYYPGVEPHELVKQKIKERHPTRPKTIYGKHVPKKIREQIKENHNELKQTTNNELDIRQDNTLQINVTHKRINPNKFTADTPVAFMEYRAQNADKYEIRKKNADDKEEVKDKPLSQTWIGQDITGRVYQFTETDPTFNLFVKQACSLQNEKDEKDEKDDIESGKRKITYTNPKTYYSSDDNISACLEKYTKITNSNEVTHIWEGTNEQGEKVTITSTKNVNDLQEFLDPDKTPFDPPEDLAPKAPGQNYKLKAEYKEYQKKKHELVQQNLRPNNKPAAHLQVQTNLPELKNAAQVCNGLTYFLQTSGTFDYKTDDRNSPYAKFKNLIGSDKDANKAQGLALSLLGFKQPKSENVVQNSDQAYQQAFADGIRELKADLSALRQRLKHAEHYRQTHGEQRYQQEVRDINHQAKALYARCDRIFSNPLRKALEHHKNNGQGLDKNKYTTRPLIIGHKTLEDDADGKTDQWTLIDEHDQEFTFNNLDLAKWYDLEDSLLSHYREPSEIAKDTKAAYDYLDHKRRFYKKDIEKQMGLLGVDIDLIPRYGEDYSLLHRIANGLSDLITRTTIIPCLVTRDGVTHDMELVLKNGDLSVHICAYDEKGRLKQQDSKAWAAMLNVVKANKKPFEKITLFWNSTSMFDNILIRNIPREMIKVARDAVKHYETNLKQRYQNEGKLASWAEHKAAMDAMLVDHSDITRDRACPLLIDMIQRFENNPKLADCPVILPAKQADTFIEAHLKFKNYLQHHFKLKAIETLVEQLANLGWSEKDITEAVAKIDKDPNDPTNILEIPESSDQLNGWEAGKSVATWVQEQVDIQAKKFRLTPPEVTPISSTYNSENKILTIELPIHGDEKTQQKEIDSVKQKAENVIKMLEADGKKVHGIEIKAHYNLTFKEKVVQAWRKEPLQEKGDKIAEKLQAELNNKHAADAHQHQFNKSVNEQVNNQFKM